MSELPLAGGSGRPPFSLEAILAEIRRELAMRGHVYPDRVARKQMSQAVADKQTRLLEDARAFLQFILEHDVCDDLVADFELSKKP